MKNEFIGRTTSYLIAIVLSLSAAGRADDPSIALCWIGPHGQPLRPEKDPLVFSRSTLHQHRVERDGARFRLQLEHRARPGPRLRVTLVSVNPLYNRVRDRLPVTMRCGSNGRSCRSPWLVLVADKDDLQRIEPPGRALRAAVGDRVEARVRWGGGPSRSWAIGVGRPAGEDHPTSLRQLPLRMVVLADPASGRPVVGGDEPGAKRVAQFQLSVLNEILAPCFIGVGAPETVEIVVEPAPGPCLLTVAEELGLPSGGGEIRLQVDNRRLGPWWIDRGLTPAQTAARLATYLVEEGLKAEVTINPKKPALAHATANVLVRAGNGGLARLSVWPDQRLSTDRQQPLTIGRVTLGDGIDTTDGSGLFGGSVEERTLILALGDGIAHTVDVFLINRFSISDRQGQSFVRASGSPLRNSLLVDWSALWRTRQSYTLAHEIGHILLDDPGHPDERGDERTELLMHSRSSSARRGPKRILPADCQKMRRFVTEHLHR